MSEQKDHPKDTVILFQLSRGQTVPSISPFPLKLETYLRIAKIAYQVCGMRLEIIITEADNDIQNFYNMIVTI